MGSMNVLLECSSLSQGMLYKLIHRHYRCLVRCRVLIQIQESLIPVQPIAGENLGLWGKSFTPHTTSPLSHVVNQPIKFIGYAAAYAANQGVFLESFFCLGLIFCILIDTVQEFLQRISSTSPLCSVFWKPNIYIYMLSS